ncbi:MAG TPA: cytochrome c [Verrucomicrobiae bacterium]|nr:cytochrome c [Verrucomicrobiae bacterium]
MKRDEKKQNDPALGTDSAEPTTGRAAAPLWLPAVFGVLFYWGTMYMDANGGGFNDQVYGSFASVKEVEAAQPKTAGGDYNKAMAETVFSQSCILCHQADGMGRAGLAPPLVGSEWVQAKGPNRIIRIVLNGLGGTIKVKDQEWTGLAMTPFGGAFNDQQIAAVISHVRARKDWGNNASIVTPEQVAAIRAKVGERGPWTPEELEKVPDAD